MDQHQRRRNTTLLLGMVVVALAYGGLLGHLDTLTGTSILDGTIGVVLGLYICSIPAANAVDIMFFERGALREVASKGSGLGWLALNVLVMLVGWVVIVIGTTRLVGRVS